MQRRNWCWTWNNPGTERPNLPDGARYQIYQLERGESGTEHLQGYTEFKRPVRMSTVKARINNAIHLEPRAGTRDQARDYCRKPESRLGDPVEQGDWVADGERTDIKQVFEAIRAGASELEIAELNPTSYARHYRAFERFRGLLAQRASQSFRAVNTVVIVGETGVGKTRAVFEREGYDRVFCQSGLMGGWWDGYNGQPVLLLDDFKGGIKHQDLLRVLDGYPLQLNVKCSSTWAQYTTVYITSNHMPATWYSRGLTPELDRRLNHVYLLTNDYMQIIK